MSHGKVISVCITIENLKLKLHGDTICLQMAAIEIYTETALCRKIFSFQKVLPEPFVVNLDIGLPCSPSLPSVHGWVSRSF